MWTIRGRVPYGHQLVQVALCHRCSGHRCSSGSELLQYHMMPGVVCSLQHRMWGRCTSCTGAACSTGSVLRGRQYLQSQQHVTIFGRM